MVLLSFYKFIKIKPAYLIKIKFFIYKVCLNNSLRGTIIIANEGINLNIEGESEKLHIFCKFFRTLALFTQTKFKTSHNQQKSFSKLKIYIKKELIKLKLNNLDIVKTHGQYLTPILWNALLKNNDILLIDVRNHYECAIGTFKKAINPKIHNFLELKLWIDEYLSDINKEQKIAMFCTGGIRAEKSTAYLKQIKGFRRVYQLHGGILTYIKYIKQLSKWQGKCFLFDDRICI